MEMRKQVTYPEYWFPREHKSNRPQSRPTELLRYCGDCLVLPKPRYSATGTNTNPHATMHTNTHVYAQAIHESYKRVRENVHD